MPDDPIRIHVAAHPTLRPAAFTSRFPGPLGGLESPGWLLDLLSLDVGFPLPVERSEELRGAVRDMLRHWGHKPAGRGKPASEYLVRAVGLGDLASINLAVDVCNVVSLHSGFPIALMDLDRIEPPFRVARGGEGERYVFNAAGQEMDLEGLICLHDARGPCANPVKDAQRVKTWEETTDTLTVIWGVAGKEGALVRALGWYRDLLGRVGAGTTDVTVSASLL